MAEKEKPQPPIVKVAARVLKKPETVTPEEAQRMAARILDDEKNDPQPNRAAELVKKAKAPAKPAAPKSASPKPAAPKSKPPTKKG